MSQRPITLPFNERKAVDAVAFLLEKANGRLNYTLVIKLLYFADRESLRERGRPVVGDRYVNMKNGQVLSRIYDLVKGETTSEHWSAHLKTVGYDLVLQQAPDLGTLAIADERLLLHFFEKYCQGNPCPEPWTAIDDAHLLPEWVDPGTGDPAAKKSIPLPVEAILAAVGRDAAEVRAMVEEQSAVDRYFKNGGAAQGR